MLYGSIDLVTSCFLVNMYLYFLLLIKTFPDILKLQGGGMSWVGLYKLSSNGHDLVTCKLSMIFFVNLQNCLTSYIVLKWKVYSTFLFFVIWKLLWNIYVYIHTCTFPKKWVSLFFQILRCWGAITVLPWQWHLIIFFIGLRLWSKIVRNHAMLRQSETSFLHWDSED